MPEFHIQTLEIGSLDPATIHTYEKLAEPKFHPCFYGKDHLGRRHIKIVGLGALWKNKPIGLILAYHETIYSRGQKGIRHAEIYSLNVNEDHRDQKIVSALLSKMETLLSTEGCQIATFKYQCEKPDASFLEKTFQDMRWEGPRLLTMKYSYIVKIFDPPWLTRVRPVAPDFTIISWLKIQKTEKDRIKLKIIKGEISDFVSPFGIEEGKIEPINSLGLLYKDKVVGWMVTHRITTDTIRYSALFIEKEFQYRGYSIRLLADSINLHKQSDVKWALFELNLIDAERSWVHFVKKRLAPYAQSIAYTKQFWRQLEHNK